MTAPWGAVRRLARHELRRRWRAIVLLGLCVGAFAGVGGALAGLAWRTDSAHERLVAANDLADLQVAALPNFRSSAQAVPGGRALSSALEEIAHAPSVIRSLRMAGFVGRAPGRGLQYYSISAPAGGDLALDRPVVVAGRMPRPESTDEVVLAETLAQRFHVRLGEEVPIDLLTEAQYRAFSTGVGTPTGGHVVLHVVGIFRLANPISGSDVFIASPGFARAHSRAIVVRSLLLATREHATAEVTTLATARDANLAAQFGRGQTPFLVVDHPRTAADPSLGLTRAVLRSGLWALIAVVAAAGVILAGQVAGRWAERSRDSQAVEHALGLRMRERLAARLLAVTPGIALAAVLALVGSLLGGLLEPLGSQRGLEPDPGWLPRPVVAVLTVLVAVVVMVVVLAASVVRAGRAQRARTGTRAVLAPVGTLRPVAMFARALAMRRGGPASTLPMRSMVAGLTAMLAVLVVVGNLHDRLSALAGERPAWGWTADFALVDDTPADDAALRADPRVRALDRVADAPVTIRYGTHTASVDGYGRAPVKGKLGYTVVAGRVPTGVDEVALGPRVAHDLGAGVGAHVEFVRPDGSSVVGVVVGTVVLASVDNEALGRNGLFTVEGLRRATPLQGYSSLSVAASSPRDAAALERGLGARHELLRPSPPAAVEALDSLGAPTRALLVILLVAAGLLVYQNIRVMFRRRGDQLVIADGLGMRRGELVGSVVAALLACSALAALVGVPVGWAISRITLVEIAPRLGLGLPSPGLRFAAAALVCVLVLTALVAAATALRRRPVARHH